MTLPKSIKVSIYLSAGLLLIYVGLVTYVCSTTKISYLINDSINSSISIIPSTVSEFFLFKFRGGKSDISGLKKEDGGLNYIVAAIDASNLSKEKKTKYLSYFISRGCGINEISTTSGLRPLHIAAIEGKAEVVELLLEKGADPMLKSEPSDIGTSMTPLEAAKRLEKKNTHIDYVKVIDLLRQAEGRHRHSGTSGSSGGIHDKLDGFCGTSFIYSHLMKRDFPTSTKTGGHLKWPARFQLAKTMMK